jgi:hypothetical protein
MALVGLTEFSGGAQVGDPSSESVAKVGIRIPGDGDPVCL